MARVVSSARNVRKRNDDRVVCAQQCRGQSVDDRDLGRGRSIADAVVDLRGVSGVRVRSKRRREVIGVVISGQLPEAELRRLGERIRDDLTGLPGITQVDLSEVRAYELAIELPEAILQKHGLTFNEVVVLQDGLG